MSLIDQGLTVEVPSSSRVPVSAPAPGVSLVTRLTTSPHSVITDLVTSAANMSSSTLLLVSLIIILIMMFCVTIYLIVRLEALQTKLESPALIRESSSPLEQLVSWQTNLQSQTSKKIQEYLDVNLQQIAKV